MADVAVAAKPGDFVAELEAANLHPLWDRFRTLTPVKPQAKDPPLIWRWRDIEPFTKRAGAEVSIDDVERRALILVNPAFAGETVTTSNLSPPLPCSIRGTGRGRIATPSLPSALPPARRAQPPSSTAGAATCTTAI